MHFLGGGVKGYFPGFYLGGDKGFLTFPYFSFVWGDTFTFSGGSPYLLRNRRSV